MRREIAASVLLADDDLPPVAAKSRAQTRLSGGALRVPALGGRSPAWLRAPVYYRQGHPKRRGRQTEAALLPKPTERDGYRTKESCQQDSRKHEYLQRNLVPAHVPFSTLTNRIFRNKKCSNRNSVPDR